MRSRIDGECVCSVHSTTHLFVVETENARRLLSHCSGSWIVRASSVVSSTVPESVPELDVGARAELDLACFCRAVPVCSSCSSVGHGGDSYRVAVSFVR